MKTVDYVLIALAFFVVVLSALIVFDIGGSGEDRFNKRCIKTGQNIGVVTQYDAISGTCWFKNANGTTVKAW